MSQAVCYPIDSFLFDRARRQSALRPPPEDFFCYSSHLALLLHMPGSGIDWDSQTCLQGEFFLEMELSLHGVMSWRALLEETLKRLGRAIGSHAPT